MDMATELQWPEITLRLLLAILAGTVLGVERSRSGHPAGLRTTLLVTLAATVSMIQMNLLLPTNGKPHDSYAVMDIMRLPLGILTGVGFIGAGAIVKKGELVIGLTTAATMWFATVVGLCFGGGQSVLGCVATGIGFAILWSLRFFEKRLDRDQRGFLTITLGEDTVSIESLCSFLQSQSLRVKVALVRYEEASHCSTFRFHVRWRRADSIGSLDVLGKVKTLPGLLSCEWSGAEETSEG